MMRVLPIYIEGTMCVLASFHDFFSIECRSGNSPYTLLASN